MDEPVLRAHIQKLTKRLIPQFETVIDASARVELVVNQPEHGPKFVKKLGVGLEWPRKNEQTAKRNREDGNAAFQSGNHELAITLYTEAMKYAQVHESMWEGETMAIAAANRSACYFQLKDYKSCQTDIHLAVEAGYPTNLVYKLYMRQCKCLLELCRIPEAQEAFDKAIDAIDRSGLKKDLRKGMAVDLQEAFINLAKSVEEDPPPEMQAVQLDPMNPSWSKLEESHPFFPSASSAVSIRYDPLMGRHAIASRDINVGEVIFRETPIVSYLNNADEDVVSTPACHHCLLYIHCALVPCPTCSATTFCSIECRNQALGTYHKYECRIGLALERTQLHRLPLVMVSLRAVAQKPLEFFAQEARNGAFGEHNLQNGVEMDAKRVYRSDDYSNLYNLVTHSERRNPLDVTTKFIFAGILVQCLKAAGYFGKEGEWKIGENELLIGRLLSHFLQCFQFNMHMVESIFSNRLIAPDSETRIWKDANKFCVGEFVETTPLGGAIYPTMANVNHSCDPNFTIVNFGNRAVAVANRIIKAGSEISDSYGAVYYHMDKAERQHYLQASHWFTCGCSACSHNWPNFAKLPRDYLKLPGTHFKYKRCNRKELQKDVDKLKKRIRQTILDETVHPNMDEQVSNHYEAGRKMFQDWMILLDELLVVPGHQDFVNVSRGIRNCLWLQSPNVVKVKETDVLKETKAKYKGSKG